MATMKILFSTLLSGALFYLSQGLDQMWFLAWIAPAPLLWLAYGAVSRRALAAASFVAFAMGLAFVIQCYAPILPPAVVAIEALSLSPPLLLFPLAVLFARFAARRLPQSVALFAFPACWSAMEFLVSLVSPHGAYLSLANSQIGQPMVIQAASLLGLFAITFLICLFASALALAAHRQRGFVAALALGMTLCAANLAYGWVRLHQPRPTAIRVAAIARNDAMAAAFKADTREAAVALASLYAAAVRDTAARGARLVVTPEAGMISRRPWDDAVLAPLAQASAQSGAVVVAGVLERPTLNPPASPPADIAVAFRPDGTRSLYAKRHLVPLLEDDLKPGRGPGLLGQGLAMVICKDMDFPGTIRADAQRAPIRVMAVPAADLVYDGWMHGRLALMRGVENGFAVVRPANQGLLTISDAQGRIVARMTAATTGMSVLVADVAPGPGATLYTRIGDLFGWLCLAFATAIGALALRGGRRAGVGGKRAASV
jgi:apolipoprotein N-acyltransferase